MIYSKKWMVVPYESDEDEKFVPDFKNKLNNHQLSDYDRVKQYQDKKTKVEQKTIQIKKQEQEGVNNNNIIKKEPIETNAENKDKQEKSLKNTVVPDYHKEELNKLSESYIRRPPAQNTRQGNLKRLQGEKRKLQRSILFNESRVLNNNKSKGDQSMIKKRPKIIPSKKKTKKPKHTKYTFARLENDDIVMEDDNYITDESSESEAEPQSLFKGKKKNDFGNISKISSK